MNKPKRIVDRKLLAVVRELWCLVCLDTPCDVHHVKTRGAGGHDLPENLMPLCPKHHGLVHLSGLWKISEENKAVDNWLILAGWEKDERRKKWIPPELLRN